MRRPRFMRQARTVVIAATIAASLGVGGLSLPGSASAQEPPAPPPQPPASTPASPAPTLAPVTTKVAPAPPQSPVAVPASTTGAPASAAAAPETTSTTSIPASLDIHAQVRYRLEIDGRDRIIPGSSTTERSFLRTRLSVKASLPKDVSVFLEAQDARVYGEEPSPESGTGS